MIEDSLQKLFLEERDKPYSLPLELGPADIGNSCLQKHYRLKREFEKLGVPVRWVEATFRWEDLPIPDDVLSLPHESPAYHVWLEVFVDGNWQTVDATWDSGLAPLFPVNNWSSPLAMQPAVPVIKLVEQEKIQISFEPLPEWQEEMDLYQPFFKALNRWLGSIRKK